LEVQRTEIDDVLEVQPRVFGDARGFFLETFHQERYAQHGIGPGFVQDNASRSAAGILRGLHLQNPHAQGKLVWVLEGAVLDVAVDARLGSPTFGKHVARRLDAERKNQLWIPPGFAHGFYVIEGPALFTYKCTDLYHPEHEIAVAWDDPDLGIDWPTKTPTLSEKDRKGLRLRDVDPSRLLPYRS
jgi:dTDP-4-dehydrorhamnose 3,5-epimerase